MLLSQILKKKGRLRKISFNRGGIKTFMNPQKKAVCWKTLTMSPKKPNSANRKIAKVKVLQYNSFLTVKIPGESHNIQKHSTLLISGGRSKDLIGLHVKAIRGKYDLSGVINRRNARSVYGVKKI